MHLSPTSKLGYLSFKVSQFLYEYVECLNVWNALKLFTNVRSFIQISVVYVTLKYPADSGNIDI